MMRQLTLMSRTCSTSSIQREVIQAKGHSGSNQKSATSRECSEVVVMSIANLRVPWRIPISLQPVTPPRRGAGDPPPAPTDHDSATFPLLAPPGLRAEV